MSLTEVSRVKVCGGYWVQYKHNSESTQTPMVFSVFFPPGTVDKSSHRIPAVYFLSGLTCTDDNFKVKACGAATAARLGLAIILPDTSPRGAGIAGEDDSWDFGTGAGFYVNATAEPWCKNYNMYDYVIKELPELIYGNLPIDRDRVSVFGHSMGGHGALIAFLKNPGKYKSVSAFAPICNPIVCPWGQKAFSNYLGSDASRWNEYDASMLAQKYGGPMPHGGILIDQGSIDSFLLAGQLLPQALKSACESSGIECILRMQDGYDHGYYFISSFIDDHLQHHAKALGLLSS